jgi:hypothetical protein
MPDFPPGHPRLNTERIVRYGPKQKAWYRLYEYPSRNGNYYIAGAYGMWGEIDSTKIETDWSGHRRARARADPALAGGARGAREAQARGACDFASRAAEQQWHDGRRRRLMVSRPTSSAKACAREGHPLPA